MWPVKFTPVPMARIWGGDTLKPMFQVSTDEPIGEYWVVSGHPSGMSVVADGPLRGKTLLQLTEEYPEAYLGRSQQERFPLLIKFLEAKHDLSVQIHPDDEYALSHEGDFGKTEAWYVLDAKPDGKVNYGHTFASRVEYEQAVAQGRVRNFLSYRDVQKGDLVFVPARTLHALLAGTTVLEIQQTSDVTYRVYDWDRVDEHGKSRELHVKKAADVLTYDEAGMDGSPVVMEQMDSAPWTRIASCAYFTIDLVELTSSYTMAMGCEGNPDVVVVLEGEGDIQTTTNGEVSTISFQAGDAILVPATASAYTLVPDSSLKAVRTFY